MPHYLLYIKGPRNRRLYSGCEAVSKAKATETPVPLRPGERLEAVNVRAEAAKRIVDDLCHMRAAECDDIAEILGEETPSNPTVPAKLTDCNIRWMIRRDMSEVLAIEKAAFEYPWGEVEFIECLRQRSCIGMVIECDERVVGFMIYELHKTCLKVINFAVGSSWRRRGMGRQMANKLIGKLSHQRRDRILIEVVETNLDALRFFRSCGFLARGILDRPYENTDADAIVMERLIQDEAKT